MKFCVLVKDSFVISDVIEAVTVLQNISTKNINQSTNIRDYNYWILGTNAKFTKSERQVIASYLQLMTEE